MKGESWGGRYNFDGYLVTSSKRESYVQVFRSGVVEAAAHPFLTVPEQYRNQIPGTNLEQNIIQVMSRYLDGQNRLSISLPIFASVALLGVAGYRMILGPSSLSDSIERDNLKLPEQLIEDYGTSVTHLLRPAFDALWQACGQEKSPNYDDEGNRRLDVGR